MPQQARCIPPDRLLGESDVEGIDHITRNQRLSFEQMSLLFLVPSIPSETQNVLEHNLSRWVAALSSDEWKKCSQASAYSEQKPALITLGKLRLAVEENRETRKS